MLNDLDFTCLAESKTPLDLLRDMIVKSTHVCITLVSISLIA